MNLSGCKYEQEIRQREKEGKEKGEKKFDFLYVLKTLNRKCGNKP